VAYEEIIFLSQQQQQQQQQQSKAKGKTRLEIIDQNGIYQTLVDLFDH
jgi:hypothetical protein